MPGYGWVSGRRKGNMRWQRQDQSSTWDTAGTFPHKLLGSGTSHPFVCLSQCSHLPVHPGAWDKAQQTLHRKKGSGMDEEEKLPDWAVAAVLHTAFPWGDALPQQIAKIVFFFL